MSGKTITRLEFWVGICASIVTIIGAGIVATWTISNSINDRVNDSRRELAGNIQNSKVEITTRIDRLEDKIDSNYKETSSSLMKIQAILESKQQNKQ
ncbi:hypothetical protein HQN64_20490 [Enterobacteriaceae bacterium BIT-l23]|uniref:hypothetical protein n=1 Tax=Jejubacter sp. L23 TaxID=3092086 RepID=UPI001585AB53|nr:hypothetical protein [Enterobacteriaceae bacterium BIT-l23]